MRKKYAEDYSAKCIALKAALPISDFLSVCMLVADYRSGGFHFGGEREY
jgi:hypothetical protein